MVHLWRVVRAGVCRNTWLKHLLQILIWPGWRGRLISGLGPVLLSILYVQYPSGRRLLRLGHLTEFLHKVIFLNLAVYVLGAFSARPLVGVGPHRSFTHKFLIILINYLVIHPLNDRASAGLGHSTLIPPSLRAVECGIKSRAAVQELRMFRRTRRART